MNKVIDESRFEYFIEDERAYHPGDEWYNTTAGQWVPSKGQNRTRYLCRRLKEDKTISSVRQAWLDNG